MIADTASGQKSENSASAQNHAELGCDCKILFLAGLFPQDWELIVADNSRKYVQNAANKLQWAFVEGLDQHLHTPLSIINSMYLSSFPFGYKKLLIPTFAFSHTSGAEDVNVGFTNLTLYKHWSRERTIRKHIKKWIDNNKEGVRIVIAYAATGVMVNGLNYAKRLDNSIITCLIVPDLPEFMRPGREFDLIATIKKMTLPSLYRKMHEIDSFVFLTKAMAEYMRTNKPYKVVEGIARPNPYATPDSGKYLEEKKIFLYSGGIEEAYGVIELVKAFTRLEETNVELVLCGSGEAEKQLSEHCKTDKRIKYIGIIPNDEVLGLQAQAHYLVNPRRSTGDFTKYSFPSKIMEYLASGSVVMTYFLPGMPDEYSEFLYRIDEQQDGLYNALRGCLALSSEECIRIARDGQRFVSEKKNPQAQCRKIIDMIGELSSGLEH